jgi:hypothetical protein
MDDQFEIAVSAGSFRSADGATVHRSADSSGRPQRRLKAGENGSSTVLATSAEGSLFNGNSG